MVGAIKHNQGQFPTDHSGKHLCIMNFWMSYIVKIAPADEVKKKREVEPEIIHVTKYHCHFGSSIECETLTEALSVCILDGQIEVQLGVLLLAPT